MTANNWSCQHVVQLKGYVKQDRRPRLLPTGARETHLHWNMIDYDQNLKGTSLNTVLSLQW